MRAFSKTIVCLALVAACGANQTVGQPHGYDSKPAVQPARAAWGAFCRISQKHELYRLSGSKRGEAIAAAVRGAVTNKTVLAALQRGKLPDSTALRVRLRDAGVKTCPFVDYLERTELAARCRKTGDAVLCYRVGDLYARQNIYPAEERVLAPLFFARACINGSVKACARRAAYSNDNVVWLERACRRGHSPSCDRLVVENPVPARVSLINSTPTTDAVVDKVKKVYVQSLVDCFEKYARTRTGTSTGRIAFKFRLSGGEPIAIRTNAFNASVATCLKQQISQWSFPGSLPVTRAYRFCYQLKGKSMLSTVPGSRPHISHLFSAIGPARLRGRRKYTSHAPGRSLRRIAKRVIRLRGRYPYVTVYTPTARSPRSSLSVYDVRRSFHRRRWYLGRCFKSTHMRKRSGRYRYVNARAKLRFSVDPAGKVVAVSPVGRISNAKFRSCLEGVLRSMTFKPPKIGGTPTTSIYEVRFNFTTSTYRQSRPPVCEYDSF